MPYKSISDLPETIRIVLPEHAQEIYLAAFNHACHEYKSHAGKETICFEVAWAAVKKKYSKGDDGNWHLRESR